MNECASNGATLSAKLLSGDRQAEPRDARQHYGWFTEGFDTADLKEAKGLLDVLAA